MFAFTQCVAVRLHGQEILQRAEPVRPAIVALAGLQRVQRQDAIVHTHSDELAASIPGVPSVL